MIHGTDARKPILVLDFDGTVCIGDAPVWAYAEAVLTELATGSAKTDSRLKVDLRRQLKAFLDGTPGSFAYTDGYDAVARLAGARATPDQLHRAYLVSRRALATGTVSVSAPRGLHELLEELSGAVEQVLVTNAPIEGVLETIETLGLADVLTRVVTDAGKPEGWAQLLPELVGSDPSAPIMVVGDIWGNDIARPLEFGCATALVNRFRYEAGPAHAVAETLEDLYPALREWAVDPVGFLNTHALHGHTTITPTTSPTHRIGMP